MAFWKKKSIQPFAEIPKTPPKPAYLRDDYPYKAIGDRITDMSQVKDSEVYEIKCHQCEMSIHSHGQSIRNTYERLKGKGCLGCGNKDLVVKIVVLLKINN